MTEGVTRNPPCAKRTGYHLSIWTRTKLMEGLCNIPSHRFSYCLRSGLPLCSCNTMKQSLAAAKELRTSRNWHLVAPRQAGWSSYHGSSTLWAEHAAFKVVCPLTSKTGETAERTEQEKIKSAENKSHRGAATSISPAKTMLEKPRKEGAISWDAHAAGIKSGDIRY